MDLKHFVRDVQDFPKPGILFKDITPLLSNPEAFSFAVEQLAKKYQHTKVDAIAAAEARGFLLAAPLAYLLKKPLIPLRKPGKLPYATTSYSYDLEYGSASLHMHVDAIKPGDHVLLVDDVLATGGTMQAACKLVEQAKGKVAGCAFLIELSFLEGAGKLPGYELYCLLSY
ncbi:MAG: adenine phosphoribosyltransferase [Planctomycetia bacterium]|nr:adenine phosphoribosyltransferase [Planctomycetia bacterium]